jgi:hypothetical protein
MTNSAATLFDLCALGCGAYCMYTWLRLLIEKHLFKNGLLVPKEKKVSDCSDEAAYIAYIRLPLALLAIVTTAYSILMTLNDNLEKPLYSGYWTFLALAVALAPIVWYAVRNSKANKMFFGM